MTPHLSSQSSVDECRQHGLAVSQCYNSNVPQLPVAERVGPSPVPDASIALRFHDFRVVQYTLNHLFADFGMPNVVELLELVSTLKQRRLPWQGQIEELTRMYRISRIILGATPLSCSILYIRVDHRRFAKSCVTHMPFGLIAKPRWTSS